MLVLVGSTLYAAASGTSKLVVQCEENPLTVSIRPWMARGMTGLFFQATESSHV